MKIVVLGGRGLIGAKAVEILRKQGHDVVVASTKSGVNSVTGEGLAEAFKGAEVVVDVTNSPSFEDGPVMEFFEKSTRNQLEAAEKSGVKHHVSLSIVGTEQLPESGYMRAKVVQERLIKAGKVPYTIVQATQFYEFLGGIADSCVIDGKVHLSTGNMQPIAAADVSAIIADIVVSKPANGTVQIAGPERIRMCDIVAEAMKANHDNREVVAAADAKYFGTALKENSLVPTSDNFVIGPTKLKDWLHAAVK